MAILPVGTRVRTLVDCSWVSANSVGTIVDVDEFDGKFMYEITFDGEEDSFWWASECLSYWLAGEETKNWIEVIGEEQ